MLLEISRVLSRGGVSKYTPKLPKVSFENSDDISFSYRATSGSADLL